jgi:hypothetical protein
MTIQSTDLVIRFDERTNKILLLVADASAGGLRTLYEFRKIDEFEQAALVDDLGNGVIAFLRMSFADRFPVPNSFEADGAPAGNAESCSYDDALLLIERLGDDSTLADLDSVSAILEKVASGGDEKARTYLVEKWPALRAVFVRRISRGRRP